MLIDVLVVMIVSIKHTYTHFCITSIIESCYTDALPQTSGHFDNLVICLKHVLKITLLHLSVIVCLKPLHYVIKFGRTLKQFVY